MRFDSKVVAVTGAAGGIGQALTAEFGAKGARIVALDVRPEVEESAARLRRDGVEAQAAIVDVADAGAVRASFETVQRALGAVDVLVNNAGYSEHPTLRKTSPEQWRGDVDGNLNGAYNCVHAVLPGMVERGSGVIVTVGSVNGLLALGDPAYSAAKAALISLTHSIAVEYGRSGVRANIVLPGTVRTPLWNARIARDPDVFSTLARWYPLDRIAEPIDVANAVVFLASDLASAITGASLTVDCGLTAGNIVMARELTLDEL
jgi:NAD(P)-dependent dehydrogenase (short-subunit alcohol dehydrogenase family)